MINKTANITNRGRRWLGIEATACAFVNNFCFALYIFIWRLADLNLTAHVFRDYNLAFILIFAVN